MYVNINPHPPVSYSDTKTHMDCPSSHFRFVLESDVKINMPIHRFLLGDEK